MLHFSDLLMFTIVADIALLLYVETNFHEAIQRFLDSGCYMPIIYEETSIRASDIPRASNLNFIRHEEKISDILSLLDSIPAFSTPLLETSRIKSIYCAQDQLRVLRLLKEMSWKIHSAEQEKKGINSILVSTSILTRSL